MNPIINPWWVYLAEKCEILQAIFCAIGIVGVLLIIMHHVIDEVELKKIPLTFFIMMSFIGMVIPSKTTVLTMMTLHYVTPNNIEIIGDTVEDTVDYITDIIKDIIDKK